MDPHIRTQLNYWHFLISHKESRYADTAPVDFVSSLKIEAIYEHNVKSNTMQTLISRARYITAGRSMQYFSKARVSVHLFLFFFLSRLLVR